MRPLGAAFVVRLALGSFEDGVESALLRTERWPCSGVEAG